MTIPWHSSEIGNYKKMPFRVLTRSVQSVPVSTEQSKATNIRSKITPQPMPVQEQPRPKPKLSCSQSNSQPRARSFTIPD